MEATESDRIWRGEGSIPAAGDIDVLLWPSLASCGLTTLVGARTGSTMAPIANNRVLIVGGAGSPPTYVARMDTGAIEGVTPDLLTPRTQASVTAFGTGALIAGGMSADGTVLNTAETFEPSAGGFDQQQPILLSEPRTEHGAGVLVTGETLLVGGVGSDGKTVLSSMERVDPVTRTVHAEGLAQLALARRQPTVMRLASGEVLVAGGLDGNGQQVTTLEWFSPDARMLSRQTRDLGESNARAYIPLEGGGALAVIVPPSLLPGLQNVWVIDATGVLESATAIQGTLTAPSLFGGAGGAPLLWTGDRWLRWQPWTGSFGAVDVLDDTPATVGDATCSPDPGLAAWVDPVKQTLTALRFDVASDYDSLPGPLLVSDASNMAPDRLVANGTLSFDTTLGGLTMAPGATAFVADRTYADVSIDVMAPTGEPALVVLRDALGVELQVGSETCPVAFGAGMSALHVERHGATVTWSVAGGSSGTCATGVAAGARLSVGVRGAAGATRSVAGQLTVTRLGSL